MISVAVNPNAVANDKSTTSSIVSKNFFPKNRTIIFLLSSIITPVAISDKNNAYVKCAEKKVKSSLVMNVSKNKNQSNPKSIAVKNTSQKKNVRLFRRERDKISCHTKAMIVVRTSAIESEIGEKVVKSKKEGIVFMLIIVIAVLLIYIFRIESNIFSRREKYVEYESMHSLFSY